MKDLTQFEPKYRTLIGYLTGREIQHITVDEKRIMIYTLKSVAEKTKIPEGEIISRCRNREIAEARNIFCKAARVQGITFEKIGLFIGLNHATVMHAVENVDFIPSLKKKYRELFAE